MTNSPTEKTNDQDILITKPLSPASKLKAKVMSKFCVSIDDDPIIFLNIGGTHMSTRRSTLTTIPNTVLALACESPWSETISHDENGRLFFDFDPNLFSYLLNQLREWSFVRKVFDLPQNSHERQRFRSLCLQLNFNPDLIDGIHRHEKFNKFCGHIRLDEKGLIARHADSYRYSECRGMNVYSLGIHRIFFQLKIEEIDKYHIFIGIIWSGTNMQENSFLSSTAYGWTGEKQVYLKGLPSIEGYAGYDSDMCTNDIVELILNCQLHLISLSNHRTKKLYEIPIDIEQGCPFPWQIHINLYSPNDQIKILNPT